MLKANDKILFQKLGDEAVILHLDSEEYFGLDHVGTRVWEILMEEGSMDKALPKLLEEYDVDTNELKKDMEELVASLKSEKILVET